MKVALVKHGEKLWKQSRQHQLDTMDLAEMYYKQKVLLVDALVEELTERPRAQRISTFLGENNYNLDTVPDSQDVRSILIKKWQEWCKSDACFHEPGTVKRFIQFHVNLGMEFEKEKLANFSQRALRNLARENMPHDFIEGVLEKAGDTEKKWDTERLREYYEESDLPTQWEANEQARKYFEKTGERMIVLARNGRMYTGMSREEHELFRERVSRSAGVLRAIKEVAEIAGSVTPLEWLEEQPFYQEGHLEDYADIVAAVQWLQRLVKIVKPLTVEYKASKSNGESHARQA